jgi:hypothetical protein
MTWATYGDGAAEEDREVVVDEFAAATCKNGRSSGQARSLRLATVGREPSESVEVWKHGAAAREN